MGMAGGMIRRSGMIRRALRRSVRRSPLQRHIEASALRAAILTWGVKDPGSVPKDVKVETPKVKINDHPLMAMKFRTMDDDEMDPKKFDILWKKVEAEPVRAIRTIHEWIRQGKLVSKKALISICHKLCYERQQLKALQIIDWIIADKPFTLTPRDYVLQVKLTCRYRSPVKAERIYDQIPPELKTEDVAVALVTTMARSNAMAKAEVWNKALKLKNPRVCNMMMILLLRRNRHREVLQHYKEFVASGGQPNPLTYLILFKNRSRIGPVDGLEEAAQEALEKIDIHDENVRSATRADMMVVYAYLGKLEMVEKLWSMVHKEEWTLAGRFVAAINAFGILGKVSRAEEVLHAVLKTRKKAIQKPYCAMIGVYTQHGMMNKAEQTMEALRRQLSFPWFAPFNHLVSGYIAKNEPDKALAKLEEGMNYVVEKRIDPDYEMVLGMMPVFASKKDVAGAEKLMSLFGCYGDSKLYNALLRVYVEANVFPGEFLKRMERNKVLPDEETHRILKFEAPKF